MSKKKKKKTAQKNRGSGVNGAVHASKVQARGEKTAGRPAGIPTRVDVVDMFRMAPGILMCAMLVIMLVMDIVSPGMAERQFVIFPGLFDVLDYLIIAAGLVCLGISVKQGGLTGGLEKTDLLFAGFGLLILISTFANGFDPLDVSGVPYRFIGIFNMLAFMLIYMGVTRSVRSEAYTDYILYAYMGTADLIGLAAVIDRAGAGFAAFAAKKEMSAIFFNGNHYGYFLLMAVLTGFGYWLFGSSRAAVFGAATAALNFILLIINHSLGSILALLIVTAATSIIVAVQAGRSKGAKDAEAVRKAEGCIESCGGEAAKGRSNQETGRRSSCGREQMQLKKLGILAAVLIAAFIAAILVSADIRKEFTGLAADLGAILSGTAEGSAGHRRLQMWTLAAGYIAEKPLLGYGCEGIAFMLYEAMGVSDPHSELINYAASYGIPAALMYAAGVTAVILKSIKSLNRDPVPQGAGRSERFTPEPGSPAFGPAASRAAACMAASGYFISSLVGVGMFYTLPFFFIFLGLAARR